MKDKKKITMLIIGTLSIMLLIFGASYAYFQVQTSNNFGTTTIEGTADALGSVALNGTSAELKLHLPGPDMMQASSDITYWATADGTPSTTQNVVTVGSTEVTGSGYFNCNYTLSVTATGTNNMYTAFQGMSGKSAEQIVLKVGDIKYDFNTSSLFPLTINGTLEGLTSTSSKDLTAEFYVINKSTVNQSVLAGTDISLSVTATNFSCTAVEAPLITTMYYTYNEEDKNNDNWGYYGYATTKQNNPSSEWQYYIKEVSEELIAEEDVYGTNYGEYDNLTDCESDASDLGLVGGICEQVGAKYAFVHGNSALYSYQECEDIVNDWGEPLYCVKRYSMGETYTKVTNEVCGVFNNSSNGTVCLSPNNYTNVNSYYAKMHNLGLSCNDYQNTTFLRCSNGETLYQSGSLFCSSYANGYVDCSFYAGSFCEISSTGLAECIS